VSNYTQRRFDKQRVSESDDTLPSKGMNTMVRERERAELLNGKAATFYSLL